MESPDQFGCCLETALLSVDEIEDEVHLYNITKECNVHFHPPLNESYFISAVVHFYMYEMENMTVCLAEDFCKDGTRPWYMAYVCFWSVALLIGIIGNALVCFAFLQSAMLRNAVTNYFVTSLAVSDLLVVVFIIPLKIHFALHNQEFCAPMVFCKAFYTSDMTFFVASMTNLFVVSVDRYIAITRPYDYRIFLTPRRAKAVVFLIWVYSAAWGVMVQFNPSTMGFDAVYITNNNCSNDNQLFYRISYVTVFYIPSLVMFFIYFKILRISRKHARHIDARRCSHAGVVEGKTTTCPFFPSVNYFTRHKLEVRVTKVVLAVYGTFLTCWLPLVFINTFQHLLSTKFLSPVVYSIVGEILPITNSLLNPFIYGILHRDFRKTLLRMLNTMMLEYQVIGSMLRRSSQSEKSCDASSQVTNQNLDGASSALVINESEINSTGNEECKTNVG